MGDSIRELKAILDAKGGTPGSLSSDDFQSLKSYIDSSMTYRETELPGDTGQNRSGIDCLTHSIGSRYINTELSIGDLNDWQAPNLHPLTCSSQTYTSAWCTSRTTCTCDNRTTCSCNGRTWCDCNGRTTCACHNRTLCNCNARIGCSCHGRTACDCNGYDPGGCGVVTGANYPWCACYSRLVICKCRGRTSACVSRTVSDCTSRVGPADCLSRSASCVSRTDYTCTSRSDYLCTSRTTDITVTGCSCDARCSCNTVDVFS